MSIFKKAPKPGAILQVARLIASGAISLPHPGVPDTGTALAAPAIAAGVPILIDR